MPKKSAAQIQREINEVLAKKPTPHYRSSVSGRFVQKDSARRRPRTTVKESHATVRQPTPHYRSSVSGRYVQKDSARRRPRTTVKESHATKQKLDKLDEFTRQYLETALWSETDDDGTPLDRNYSISDFAPEALAAAIKVSKEFQASNEDDLNETSGDDGQHGHDFWLTRNGHGAGFWDRGYGPVGKKLTAAAKAYGSEDIYVGDDGLLYFS